MTADRSLVEYYRRRASEYEEIYSWRDPVRHEEQEMIAVAIQSSLKGRNVLELACGTGWWTRILSASANSIMATDLGDEVLKVAKEKEYDCPVTFRKEDAYDLSFKDCSFNGGLAFSWFSHIPTGFIDGFLKGFHRVMAEGSRVFIADNVYIQGIGGQLIRRKGDSNTYKIRMLRDGGVFTIVKNYYSAEELLEIFGRHVGGLTMENVFYGKCFWYADYVI